MKEVKKDFWTWISEIRKALHNCEVLEFSISGVQYELAHVYVDQWSGTYMLGVYIKGSGVAYGIPARQVFMDENVTFNFEENENEKSS